MGNDPALAARLHRGYVVFEPSVDSFWSVEGLEHNVVAWVGKVEDAETTVAALRIRWLDDTMDCGPVETSSEEFEGVASADDLWERWRGLNCSKEASWGWCKGGREG